MKTNPKSAGALLEAYVDHLKEHGAPPKSVFTFCKTLKIKEREFYAEFASFEALEARFWQQLIQGVITAVQAGEEWKSFTTQQRLLAFLFAFFEEVLNHRSLFLLRFQSLSPWERPAFARDLETAYKTFADALMKTAVENREVADRGRLNSLYPEALYLHLRGLIDFNLKDTSPGYEKTDAFIEKSVVFAFDLLRTSALESAFDLAKMVAQMPRSADCSGSTRTPEAG